MDAHDFNAIALLLKVFSLEKIGIYAVLLHALLACLKIWGDYATAQYYGFLIWKLCVDWGG